MQKLLIASITFIALAFGFFGSTVMADEFVGADSVKIDKASFVTLTPAMAARSQRFYVGD